MLTKDFKIFMILVVLLAPGKIILSQPHVFATRFIGVNTEFITANKSILTNGFVVAAGSTVYWNYNNKDTVTGKIVIEKHGSLIITRGGLLTSSGDIVVKGNLSIPSTKPDHKGTFGINNTGLIEIVGNGALCIADRLSNGVRGLGAVHFTDEGTIKSANDDDIDLLSW